jgi:hypothetical protein
MLRDARMTAMTGRAAAFGMVAGRRLWAGSDISEFLRAQNTAAAVLVSLGSNWTFAAIYMKVR